MATATFKVFTRTTPCPICGATSECREATDRNDGRRQVHCRGNAQTPSGWGHVGEDSHGFQIFLDQWDSKPSQRDPEEIARMQAEREAATRAHLDSLVPLADRHKVYFSPKLLSAQALTTAHRSELIRRGWSEAMVDYFESLGWLRSWKVGTPYQNHPKNLAGFGRNRATGNDGLAISAVVKGKIAGFQVKPDESVEGRKYVWISRNENAGLKEFGGELPLFLWRHPETEGNAIAHVEVSEGALKSATIAQRVWAEGKTDWLVIGAGGSNWASAETQWVNLLQHLPADATITLSPDSGAIKNPHVSRQMSKLADLLASHGRALTVRWWGQFAKVSGDDPDEIAINEFLKAPILTWEQYTAISDAADPVKGKSLLWDAPTSYQGQIGRWVVDKAELARMKAAGEWAEGMEPPKRFRPNANFDFQVEAEIEADPGQYGAGLRLRFQREGEDVSRVVTLPAESSNDARSIYATLTRGAGRWFASTLTTQEWQGLLANRQIEYRERGGQLYRMVSGIGRQSDGSWVFPGGIEYTADGQFRERSKWVYTNEFRLNEAGETTSLKEPSIAKPSDTAIPDWINGLAGYFGPTGFAQALFLGGFVAAGVHFDTIQEQEGFFPILNAIGSAGVSKSVTAEAALALVGQQDCGMIARASVPQIYTEGDRRHGLAFCLDDPDRNDPNVDELLKGWFNALTRSVTGKTQKPHSPIMATSNHAIGESHPAALSRILQVPFPKEPVNGDGWDAMREALVGASGGLGQIIALGYPKAAISEYANTLRGKLPDAHSRVAHNLALVGWYAKALCRLGGADELVVDAYIDNTLIPLYNDADKAGDPLRLFISQLSALKSNDRVGRWNATPHTTKDGQKWLAVNMSSVWPEIEDRFNPVYSRETITQAIEQAGGSRRGTARFHESRDASLHYRRKTQDGDASVKVGTVPGRCVLLPLELAKSLASDVELSAPNQSTETEESEPVATEPVQSESVQSEPVTPEPQSIFPIPLNSPVVAVIQGARLYQTLIAWSPDLSFACVQSSSGVQTWVARGCVTPFVDE
ncbi:hypothetical protein [Limnothrix sp. PR1529]|uniref:hypothetical protein n=1 Tax=Limnothrix sp. PR1529 TaxID=1704291 RepID=UPI001179DB5C|nr:hypothetical protein [Limnothrix sp. PR1529]